jgi:hypothetical protein
MYSSAGFQLVSQASLALFDLNIFLHLIKKKIEETSDSNSSKTRQYSPSVC